MAAPMKVMASADTCPREQERPEPQGPPGCLEHRGLQELPEATEQPEAHGTHGTVITDRAVSPDANANSPKHVL